MKRLFLMAATGLLLLASCTKSTDLYQPTPVEPATPTPTEKPSVSTDDINANLLKVFGVRFDPNQDWSSTVNGQVKITANSSIKKVQVIVYVSEMGLDGEEVTSMRVMNEADLNGQTTITLNYDAPKDNLGIFVAFISGAKYTLKKVVGNEVNINDAAKTRGDLGLTLPTGEFKIAGSEDSYANTRGWIPGEQLYYMSDADYAAQKMTPQAYSDEFTATFDAIVFSYFKNGRSYNNLPLVKSSGYYNDKAYPFTTGEDPIIISPVYKRDGSLSDKSGKGYGYEVYNSDLYYYYFDENDPQYQANPVEFLQKLPKYKAIRFKDLYIEKEDDIIEKRGSYALIYWGKGIPGESTIGTYTFPSGLKIGFMVRAKTDSEGTKKQGELYGDGRLNNKINNWPNFSSSKLGTDGPRIAWMTFNDKKFMCWESGTDSDFNDVILEVEGGVDIPDIPIDPNYNKYTYCFEDTPIGDYDLNDVVIKAVRTNETTVTYSIVACGGYDEIYIKGIGIDNQEVHGLFGVTDTKTFINTEKGSTVYPAYTVTRTVDKNFSLADPNTAPYIVDATTNVTIELSKRGEDPHGIMIPNDFKYPLEKVCVKDAYLEFNSWGQNSITSSDWYERPVLENVYE